MKLAPVISLTIRFVNNGLGAIPFWSGVARGTLKTLMFSLCHPRGTHGLSQNISAFCPAIWTAANRHVFHGSMFILY